MVDLVDKQLSTLFNGVSQQPPTLRLPSQGEEQINCFDTVVDGKHKRPPSEHIAKLTAAGIDGAHIHEINRDAAERYVVVLIDGDLSVFDMQGNAKTVTFPHGKGYLDVASAKSDFACVTVADYTFVVNRTKVVQMENVGADQVAQPSNYWWLNRDYFGSFAYGAAIQFQYAVNTLVGAFGGTVQSFEQLPESPAQGALYKIQGTQESGFQTYYVIRNGGVWDETVAPGIKNSINATTMPHALVRKADGTFEFGPFSWAPRRVGDETSNKNPTFVGRAIKDVFFYKNRLGLNVDENSVLSRAGDFGNFFRMTVLDLLDDDVIDVAASTTQVTKLNFSVPFDEGMMVFSDQVQFRMKHGDVLRPTGVSLEPVTAYKMVPDVKPVASGSDVYFASENGANAIIREYLVLDDTEKVDAGNVTAHVPSYIPSGVSRLTASSDYDIVLVLTSGKPNRIYVYSYYWANDTEKAQSSWSYWEFGVNDVIVSARILDNFVYTVTRRSDGAYLERIPLELSAIAPGLNFQLFLDRRAVVTGVYQSVENRTVFTLPYPVDISDRSSFRIVRGPDFGGTSGATLSVDPDDYGWINSTTLYFPGNITAGEVIVGLKYRQRYTFSEQFITNGQNVPIVTGKLIIRTMTVYYVNTAFFTTEVSPYGVDPEIEEILPSRESTADMKTLGATNLTLGTPVFSSGAYQFTVGSDSKVARVSIVNDTPYACTLQQAEWEGFYHKRSRTL